MRREIRTEAAQMGEQNRESKKADREKMKELEEELDELKGNTAKGEMACALVFLLSLGLLTALFAGMIKLDIGGVAGNVLSPIIGDIPVVRSIQPAEMQRKNPSELTEKMKQKTEEKTLH